jgi:hypothetical protein
MYPRKTVNIGLALIYLNGIGVDYAIAAGFLPSDQMDHSVPVALTMPATGIATISFSSPGYVYIADSITGAQILVPPLNKPKPFCR